MDPAALFGMIAAHRSRLLEAYRGPEWAEVARAYGLEDAPREVQLRAALDAVAAWGSSLLGDGAAEGRAQLERFTEDALAETRPKTGALAGLGAIFANATANVGWWAQRASSAGSIVASCPGCGATQRKVLEFRCEYCGGELYGGRS